jgi:hypothetical protein
MLSGLIRSPELETDNSGRIKLVRDRTGQEAGVTTEPQ